ncbi:MAG: FCD domain-containing protein [Actinobacteria bacterium]|nr:FCD domain-containing protein [Actinomycetota bacterium]
MATPREQARAELRRSIDVLPERTRRAMLVGLGWFPSKNKALKRLGRLVKRGRIRLVGTVCRKPGRPEHVYCRWRPKHDQLLHAIERGDPVRAERAMREHLNYVRDLVRAVGAGDATPGAGTGDWHADRTASA